MDQYRFTLKDYHAVKYADIKLDGITVLAGLNGCGKSTIARWIYGFVRYANEFDRMMEEEAASRVYDRTVRLTEIQRRLAYTLGTQTLPRGGQDSGDFSIEAERFSARVYAMTDFMIGHFIGSEIWKNNARYDWLWRGLDIDPKSDSIETVEQWKRREEKWLDSQAATCEREKEDCSLTRLFDIIEEKLDVKGRMPEEMQFYENDIPLMDFAFRQGDKEDDIRHPDMAMEPEMPYAKEAKGRFEKPIGLRRAIYINSPLAFTNHLSDSEPIYAELKEMFTRPLKQLPEQGREIAVAISTELGGEIVMTDNEMVSREMRYVRTTDGLDIAIDDISTGMKAFAYLLRLLTNGYIDSETLLIIDEPEAHLHPQWVFKFAQILVMLHKRLGVKLLLASHDPDMVAALQTIALAEGLEEITNFYHATRVPGDQSYVFNDLGSGISDIFTDFNIALDRIESYVHSK